MTTTQPRFVRETIRGYSHQQTDDPLPGSLSQLVAKEATRHREVVARYEQRRLRRIELANAVAEAERIENEEAQEAVLKGRPAKKQKSPRLRDELELTEGEVAAAAEAVRASADALLAVALGHVAPALEQASEARSRAVERVLELQQALDAAAEEVSDLFAELAWMRSLDGRTRPSPFRAGVPPDPRVRKLRGTVSGAVAEWQQREVEDAAAAEERRRFEAENAPTEAQLEKARAYDAAARVRFEGGVLVERGGVPVRPKEET
jgi:hypothetical protein